MFEVSRQAYYQHQRKSLITFLKEQVFWDEVREIRKRQPRIGVRKLYLLIKPNLSAKEIKIGRDALYNLLREHNLLIKKRKKHVRTIQSYHRQFSEVVRNLGLYWLILNEPLPKRK